ncbi:hypothetical protein PVAND_006932 [Polypedilum vanderplanki]|uniref:Uncharacterized protein n=1 Tax=Polypedilum vanderplanki TaxID=319348 RepID=A0A9J6C6C1_POLVA|nr:hypothetical protein PVAND_006932 [Polypedilum vanderplanki]
MENFSDFHLNVKKKKMNQFHSDETISKILKKVKELPLKPKSCKYVQKLVSEKKIIDIGELIKADKRSVEFEVTVNVNVEPFEKLKNENAKVIVLDDDYDIDYRGIVHIYSRISQIGETKNFDICELGTGMNYEHELLTLLKYNNIVIQLMIKDTKSLEQIIAENPSKIVKIFEEVVKFILDISVNHVMFWEHNSKGAENILWQNQKWIILTGDNKVLNANFINNFTKVFDLFFQKGMSMKPMEKEFWKIVQKDTKLFSDIFGRIHRIYFKKI